MESWLWNEFHDLFEADDRLPPEVRVNDMGTSATASADIVFRERTAWLLANREDDTGRRDCGESQQ